MSLCEFGRDRRMVIKLGVPAFWLYPEHPSSSSPDPRAAFGGLACLWLFWLDEIWRHPVSNFTISQSARVDFTEMRIQVLTSRRTL